MRNFYIQKRYQSKMVIKLCGLTFIGSAIFYAGMYRSLNGSMGGTYSQALFELRELKGLFVRSFLLNELLTLGFVGAGVIILTLFMSHRIAGPLWRLERTAEASAAGDLSMDVRLREKDEVKFLADQMNRMVSDLRYKVGDISTALRVVEDDLTMLRERVERGEASARELRFAASEIREGTRELRSRIECVKGI